MQYNNAKKTDYLLYTILLFIAFLLLFFISGLNAEKIQADQLSLNFSSTDGSSCADISDQDYFTTEYFEPGTKITLNSDEEINALYIIWENIPQDWTLEIDGREYKTEKTKYLHEYIEIPSEAKPTNSVTVTVGAERITLADIYAFSDGTLPSFVQQWQAPYEQADILFISTHADDEVLFFGGLIPNYIDKKDVRVQVAYFSDLFQSEPYRNHEILNGLWTMGVDRYPQLGEFYDNYSESFEEAQTQFDYYAGLEYIVRTIRRFKPQVVVGQDPVNGEYGHGGHIWCARLIQDALDLAADEDSYTDSVREYGTWDVPKTYFHLYPDNQIEANARTPLSAFGGLTALEVAKQAYLEHNSQQWTWFYVSDGYDDEGNPDGYEYSCTKYGLYRSLVGDDFSGTDILDNITTYDEQERQRAKAEEESIKAAMEQEGQEETASASSIIEENSRVAIPGGRHTTLITIFVIIAIIVLVIIIAIIVLSRVQAKKREAARRRARARAKARARYYSDNMPSNQYERSGRR